jgi:hypothetical protein
MKYVWSAMPFAWAKKLNWNSVLEIWKKEYNY